MIVEKHYLVQLFESFSFKESEALDLYTYYNIVWQFFEYPNIFVGMNSFFYIQYLVENIQIYSNICHTLPQG
jgi:hypothetical protein